MKLTLNDFFCGAGGIGIGFKKAGFDIVWACDFDKYAVESYRNNVSDCVLQADVTKLHWSDIPVADVWAFGFPCQDLSVAGKQEGLLLECLSCGHKWSIAPNNKGDINCPVCESANYKAANRSGLFFEVMRLLDETEQNAPEQMPKILMAENVKGLQPYLPALKAEYARRGYEANIQLFNSKYFGVAQNRERYYIVGTHTNIAGFTFPEEQHEHVPLLSDFIDKEVDEKYFLSDEKAKKIIEQAKIRISGLGSCHTTITPDRIEKRQNGRRAKENEEPMFTLTAQDLHGVIIVPPEINVIGMLENSGTTQEHNNRVHDPDGISPTLTAVSGGTHHIKIFDYSHYRVRKLTPTEYGRLQAFPVDGEWNQVVSDSQAYKQFGNAVTTSVAKAIAESIARCLIAESSTKQNTLHPAVIELPKAESEKDALSATALKPLSDYSTEDLLKEILRRQVS